MSHKKLDSWRFSFKLVSHVYHLTSKLPTKEKYILEQQIKKAAISVPSNIAEGAGRGGSIAEYKHFLRTARGSLNELETQLLLTVELEYLSKTEIESTMNLIKRITAMLSSQLKSLKSQ